MRRVVVLGAGVLALAVLAWGRIWGVTRIGDAAVLGNGSTTAASSADRAAGHAVRAPNLPQLAPSAAEAPTTATPATVPTINATTPKVFRSQMRAALATLEPEVGECARRARASGKRQTGTATLYFVAGRDRDGSAGVETTGIEDEQTTVTDETFLACLHVLTKPLAIEIAEPNELLYASWSVELGDGEVVGIRPSDFSFRRGSDGPFD